MREINVKLVYDYYKVALPGDLEQLDGDMKKAARTGQLDEYIKSMGHHAIREAEERSRLYCVPCEWRATLLSKLPSGTVVFRVCRTRRRKER